MSFVLRHSSTRGLQVDVSRALRLIRVSKFGGGENHNTAGTDLRARTEAKSYKKFCDRADQLDRYRQTPRLSSLVRQFGASSAGALTRDAVSGSCGREFLELVGAAVG